MSHRRLVAAAAERNKEPILDALRKIIKPDKQSQILEISSGTGQHVEHFATNFPLSIFQPSEYDSSMIPSLTDVARNHSLQNICPPMLIDVTKPYMEWGKNSVNDYGAHLPIITGDIKVNEHRDFREYENAFDYIININMIHISPIECSVGLFRNSSCLLKKPNGLLITYGPYALNGKLTPQSNIDFDRGLRRSNPEWGVRDLVELETISKKFGIELKQYIDMPANNKLCIWTLN